MTDRQITHGPGCWDWGPSHYECAVREIERLRKMHQDAYQRGLQAGSKGLREMYDAVQAVKRQDAWGNAQLTEALMEAEERAERAEAENKQLRAEVGELHMHAKRRDQYAVEKAAQALDWKKRADKLAEALRELEEREQRDEALLRQALEALERGAWDTLSGRNAAFAIRERLGLGQENGDA